MYLAFDKVLVVVQVAVVGSDAEIAAHVLAAGALLLGHQRFVQLFAVAGADDAGAGVAKQRLHRLGQVADGGSVRLLDEQVAGVGVLKGEHDQVHRLVQVHQKAGHVGVGDGDGVAGLDLLHKQRDHRAAAAHDVAVPGAADDRPAPLGGHAGVGGDDVLHHRLGDAHGVDGVGGLVGGQADHPLDVGLDGRVQHVVGALDVGAHRLHGEKLAGGHLLQRRRVEDVVHAGHHVPQALDVAHVADIKFDLLVILRIVGLQVVAHIVLLFLIAGEDADLADVGGQKMLEHRVAEAAGAAGDEQCLVVENRICHNSLPGAGRAAAGRSGAGHTSPFHLILTILS